MKIIMKMALALCLALSTASVLWAQGASYDNLSIDWESVSETECMLKTVTNQSEEDVIITLITSNGKQTIDLRSGATKAGGRCMAIRFQSATSSGTLLSPSSIKSDWERRKPSTSTPTKKETPVKPIAEKENAKTTDVPVSETVAAPLSYRLNNALNSFLKQLENDPYYSLVSIEQAQDEVNTHLNHLLHWTDRAAYVKENHLDEYIVEAQKELEQHRSDIPTTILNFLDTQRRLTTADRKICQDSMHVLLEQRLQSRELALADLEGAVYGNPTDNKTDTLMLDKKTLVTIGVLAGALLLIIIGFWAARRKKTSAPTNNYYNNSSEQTTQPNIVVRRKTATILKKQSLDDVVDNRTYLKIDCADFCTDSAVRRMYIKNTCVKAIYEMYAHDLSQSNAPNENGCMVLGRWVYDEEGGEYYVSLEHVVMPGDDAVLKEYELNFGGKIKLKVAGELRRLRRETNLQYDLTCWVHSHPGLGVFFSNSDGSVQMQLKHPTHPNFLTAMVVDILTDTQELGIFTFKHDGTINAKPDLTRLYSLDEMYKWAIESERYSYSADDHYNTLQRALKRDEACHGVQLSNSAIIDICMQTAGNATGLVAWAHGFSCPAGSRVDYVVNSVGKQEDAAAGDECVGCFIVGTHCSIPSIKKMMNGRVEGLHFVLFYSTMDGMLTTIPMIDGQLATDEKYLGEEKLEELKIWTRRKR